MNVFVNATAADIGGLYTIVDQFLQSINGRKNDNNNYYIFVSNHKFNKYYKKNIFIINIKGKKWIGRIFWDTFGMANWSKVNSIVPDKIISLQNTPVKFKNKSQIIYLHTPIPFVPYRWNIVDKKQRKLWFYKNIYPFYIKLFLNKRCEIVVQANWLQKAVSNTFKMPLNRIHVIRPDVSLNLINTDNLESQSKRYKTFFYPGVEYLYKNHQLILKALKIIKEESNLLYKKIKVIFTVESESWLYKEACFLNVEDSIDFIGKVSFNEVQGIYNKADVVLFPSYIETAGLPLIEAASFGKFILCADEEYAKEMLLNYKGVEYVTTHNVFSWVTAIKKTFSYETQKFEFDYQQTNSWELFMDIINEQEDEKRK